MNDTTIELREVCSNRDGVSGYQVSYRPHRLVSSAYPFVDKHWLPLYNWQRGAVLWAVVDEECDFHGYDDFYNRGTMSDCTEGEVPRRIWNK